MAGVPNRMLAYANDCCLQSLDLQEDGLQNLVQPHPRDSKTRPFPSQANQCGRQLRRAKEILESLDSEALLLPVSCWAMKHDHHFRSCFLNHGFGGTQGRRFWVLEFRCTQIIVFVSSQCFEKFQPYMVENWIVDRAAMMSTVVLARLGDVGTADSRSCRVCLQPRHSMYGMRHTCLHCDGFRGYLIGIYQPHRDDPGKALE